MNPLLTLTLFLGLAVLLDLRLLGAILLRKRASDVLAQLNPWLMMGFVIMSVSGPLSVWADEPLDT